MVERYLKVLALYIISTLIPTLLVNTQMISKKSIKHIVRIGIGYGIFAFGLTVLTKIKNKRTNA